MTSLTRTALPALRMATTIRSPPIAQLTGRHFVHAPAVEYHVRYISHRILDTSLISLGQIAEHALRLLEPVAFRRQVHRVHGIWIRVAVRGSRLAMVRWIWLAAVDALN